MALGFGGNVASLKATLTLDDDGFIKGMADASAKLDAYNAKLKEEGVGRRFATMASKDYARQLYDEARGVDQATQSHGRLITTLQSAQRHWKLLGASTAAAGVGVLALTGHLGTLTGTLTTLGASALPAVTSALSGILAPFTTLAAIVVGLLGPMSALVTLFGVVGAGAGIGLYKSLTGTASAFAPVRKMLQGAKQDFHDLGIALGKDFLPYAEKGVQWLDKFLQYGLKLANMKSLGDVIHSISTQGVSMLEHLNRQIYNLIGRPILQIFSASFGQAGNRISGAFAHIIDVWKPLAGRLWTIFSSWFDKQHFEQTGAQWAAALTSAFIGIVLPAIWSAFKSTFSQQSFWGKVGMIAGVAFAANFVSGGLLTKIGTGLGKMLLTGVAGAAGLGRLAGAGGGALAGAEGVAGGAAATGGGLLAGVSIGAIAAAVVPVALVAAEAYASSHASRLNPAQRLNQVMPGGGTTAATGEAAFGQARFGHLISADMRDAAAAGENYLKVLKRIGPEQKSLNQFISDGGKSVKGWKIAMQEATNQGSDTTKALKGLADNGFISAQKAASGSKQAVQTFINQMDGVAKKATTASQNTTKFGSATRAQYAHVAALARTSAQLASAIDSIPSQKYVSLVLSITENLKTEGLNPGNARTQAGLPSATGGLVTGGTPNRDSVPILAMPGEVVLSKAAVAALGGPYAANSLNTGSPILRMAAGGVVPPKIPSTVLNAPNRFKNPPWYRDDRQLAPRLKAAEQALKHAQNLPNPTGTTKADNDARNARAKAIAAAKARLHDVKLRMANNSPKLAQWLSNRVNAIDSTMQFNEQTWDAQYQNTGNSAWFDKEQAQRLQEVALYKRAAAYATAHHLNATPYRQASITAWQAYQAAAGQSSSAAAGASAQEIASFLSTQQGFLSEFASNIILPGAQAILSGGINPGASTSSGGSSGGPTLPNRTLPAGGISIHNHFTQTPPDTFIHIRKAKLQAEAVFGS